MRKRVIDENNAGMLKIAEERIITDSVVYGIHVHKNQLHFF